MAGSVSGLAHVFCVSVLLASAQEQSATALLAHAIEKLVLFTHSPRAQSVHPMSCHCMNLTLPWSARVLSVSAQAQSSALTRQGGTGLETSV